LFPSQIADPSTPRTGFPSRWTNRIAVGARRRASGYPISAHVSKLPAGVPEVKDGGSLALRPSPQHQFCALVHLLSLP